MLLRASALIAAPAPTVAGALLRPPTRFAVDTTGPLCIDDVLTARVGGGRVGRGRIGRSRVERGRVVTLRVSSAGVDGITLVGHSGVVRTLTVRAELAATGAGTQLTYGIEWATGAGELVDALIGRRRVLASLSTLCAAAREHSAMLSRARCVVAAAIVRGGRVLAAQRARPVDLADRWELPGGKVEPDEREPAALARECAEELGFAVRAGDRVGVDVGLPGDYVLRAYAATPTVDGEPKPLQHKRLRWLAGDELGTVDWLPADRALLPAIRQLLITSPT